MKAVRIYPSSPISFPSGSRKFATYVSKFISSMVMFDISHITIPAGAAIAIALPSTNIVFSNIERVITFIICGFLYGGSSNTKDVGSPFSIVLDSNLEINKVIIIPNNITTSTAIVDIIDEY